MKSSLLLVPELQEYNHQTCFYVFRKKISKLVHWISVSKQVWVRRFLWQAHALVDSRSTRAREVLFGFEFSQLSSSDRNRSCKNGEKWFSRLTKINILVFFVDLEKEGSGGGKWYEYNMVGGLHVGQVWAPELAWSWRSSFSKMR